MNCGVISAARRRTTVGSGSTVLLLGFEGVDGATTTSDESPAAHGASTGFFGSAQIDTAQFKFGSSSLLLTTAGGDFITFGDSDDWTFTGDFTIEAWVRFSNLTGFQSIISQWNDGGAQTGKAWLLDFPGSANNVLRVGLSSDGTTSNFIQKAWTPSANTWYHVAVDRSGSTVRLYADGASLGSGTFAGAVNSSGEGLRIGAFFNGTLITNPFKGWIDELRITKGLARYATDSAYTIPSAAFPR